MASSLTEAVMGSLAYNLNPENQATATYVTEITEKLRDENRLRKIEQIQHVSKLIADAKSDDSVPASVLDAYDRMLTQLTS